MMRCPHCGSTAITKSMRKNMKPGQWWCQDCNNHFYESEVKVDR